jgi:hypothetical protein
MKSSRDAAHHPVVADVQVVIGRPFPSPCAILCDADLEPVLFRLEIDDFVLRALVLHERGQIGGHVRDRSLADDRVALDAPCMRRAAGAGDEQTKRRGARRVRSLHDILSIAAAGGRPRGVRSGKHETREIAGFVG